MKILTLIVLVILMQLNSCKTRNSQLKVKSVTISEDAFLRKAQDVNMKIEFQQPLSSLKNQDSSDVFKNCSINVKINYNGQEVFRLPFEEDTVYVNFRRLVETNNQRDDEMQIVLNNICVNDANPDLNEFGSTFERDWTCTQKVTNPSENKSDVQEFSCDFVLNGKIKAKTKKITLTRSAQYIAGLNNSNCNITSSSDLYNDPVFKNAKKMRIWLKGALTNDNLPWIEENDYIFKFSIHPINAKNASFEKTIKYKSPYINETYLYCISDDNLVKENSFFKINIQPIEDDLIDDDYFYLDGEYYILITGKKVTTAVNSNNSSGYDSSSLPTNQFNTLLVKCPYGTVVPSLQDGSCKEVNQMRPRIYVSKKSNANTNKFWNEIPNPDSVWVRYYKQVSYIEINAYTNF